MQQNPHLDLETRLALNVSFAPRRFEAPSLCRGLRVAQDLIDIALRLGAALAAGGLIGFEQSFHGRPAGFRTHALVCLGAAMLMLVPPYQAGWLGIAADDNFSTNPSRIFHVSPTAD